MWRSFTNIKNSRGPNTDPCGIPVLFTVEDITFSKILKNIDKIDMDTFC